MIALRWRCNRVAECLVAVVGFGVLAFAGGLVTAAQAEELGGAGELPDVGERYGGQGINFHGFQILSTVETGVFYDSNPDSLPSGGDGSGGIYVAPNVQAKSDFGQHALNFSLGGDHSEYFDSDVDSRTNIFGNADARIDVRHDLVVTAGVNGAYLEDTMLATSYGGVEPEPFTLLDLWSTAPSTTVDVWSQVDKQFNRVTVSLDGAYAFVNYDDTDLVGGGTLDQDFRDGDGYEVGGRVGYAFSPGYSVFVDIHYNELFYDNGVNDSSGWRGLTGVEFEITRLIRGEVGVGYFVQDYDSGNHDSDFSYHVGLIWNPTMLMTVRLAGDRMVGESDVVGSPGTTQTTIMAAVDYEVLRTLVISPSVGVEFDDYVGSSLDSRSFAAAIGVDYSVNSFLSVGADFEFEDVDYSTGGGDYERYIVGVNAKANF